MESGDKSAQGNEEHSFRGLAEILLWTTPLIWSSNYVIARAANGHVSPHVLAFGRWLIAALLMLPFIWKSREKIHHAVRIEWPHMMILGALGTWICGAFVYIGGHSTSAGNIALIFAATPVGIAVAGSYYLKEKLSTRQVFGMAFALIGVLFIIAKGDIENLISVRFIVGDLWIVTAALAWVAYTILQQRWPTRLSPIERLFCSTVGGLFILLPFSVWEIYLTDGRWLSWHVAFLMLLAGILPGLLSYLAYSFMVKQLGAARAGLVLYLSPVYTSLVAWWILGETIPWFYAVGAAFVLPSIYLSKSK